MADNPLPIQNPLAEDGLFMVCRECFWYRGSLLTGFCRGAPPALVVTSIAQGNAQMTGFWPQVPGDEFCAVFKADRDKSYDDIAGLRLLGSASTPQPDVKPHAVPEAEAPADMPEATEAEGSA